MCHLNRYLRPALEDDAILLCLEELLLPADVDFDEPMERGYEEQNQQNAGGADASDGNSPPLPPQPTPRKPVDTEAISGGKGAAAAAACTVEEGAGVYMAGATSTDLESENVRLREALRDAEERMRRANRALRGLVVGGEGEGGKGGVRVNGGSSDGSGEGPTAGVVSFVDASLFLLCFFSSSFLVWNDAKETKKIRKSCFYEMFFASLLMAVGCPL